MPETTPDATQLTLIDLAEPPAGPIRFRLDRDTRLRGLAHVAELKAVLRQRLATTPEPPASDRAPGRAA